MRTWTCQRQTAGVKCGHVNPRRLQICEACSKRRPKSPSSPRAVPDVPYEVCVEMFGETCGICGRGPKNGRKLHRDHQHGQDTIRGILCPKCNIALASWMRSDWLRAAADYLDRHAAKG